MEPPNASNAEFGPAKIGDLFQGYRILKLLGQGGYASVYHARREFTGRDVAIKISNRAVTDEVFKRFQAEARFILNLDHPNIVKAHDAAVATSGHIYIVMELLSGQTFWDARKQYGTFTIPEALHLCAEVADGVEKAHRAGAIHRDLKPLNLFIILKNRAKVLDFGIAKIADDLDRSSTQRNVVHGTLKYMSPEQLLAEPLTPHSDIYALAVIFFELITGRHPHILENAELTEAQLGLAIVSRAAASLASIDSSIPSDIVEVIEKALSRDPAKRFASMAEFAEALRKCYERYVQEFPEFAELRELWIPAPTVSAVVRSAEPPSQRHIATAVVAVVPAQSLRPTVRVDTAPKQPSSEPGGEPQLIAANAAIPVQLAPTPARVTDGVAVPAASLKEPQSGASSRRFRTFRRIVTVGAAVGFLVGVGVTFARLRPKPTPKPASSTENTRINERLTHVPVEISPPSPMSSKGGGESLAPAQSQMPSTSAVAPSPRRPPVTPPKSRSRSTDKKADDRLDWFQEDKRPTTEAAANSGL